MMVTKHNFPLLFKAVLSIELDNGMINRLEPARDEYDLPIHDAEIVLPKVETALASLTGEQLETLCTGEESEILALINGNEGLTIASQLLNDFFNGDFPE